MNEGVKVVGWKIWFDDRTTIDSRQSTWGEVALKRPDGVQVIMLYHADGTRRVMSGNDYYWRWDSGFGLVYAHADTYPDAARYPGAVVLRGKWTSDENLAHINAEAMETKWL